MINLKSLEINRGLWYNDGMNEIGDVKMENTFAANLRRIRKERGITQESTGQNAEHGTAQESTGQNAERRTARESTGETTEAPHFVVRKMRGDGVTCSIARWK